MKYREIIFFIKLKFIIGCRNMFEHTCHGILFIVMSVFKLKIQNDSKAFLNEFQMAFGKKTKEKENLPLSIFLARRPKTPLLGPSLPAPSLFPFLSYSDARTPRLESLTAWPHLLAPSSTQRRQGAGLPTEP